MADLATGTAPSEGSRVPRLLFVALDDYLGIERLPATCGALGATCAVLSPPGFNCLASRAVQRWFPLPAHRGLWLGLAFVQGPLEKAVRRFAPDLVIPLDDIAAQYLRVLGRSAKPSDQLRSLIERSFGAPEGYAAVSSRMATMAAARRLGLRVPSSIASHDCATLLAQAAAWRYPVVLKIENSCGGHGVTIARHAEELRAALAHAQGRSLWQRFRRRVVSTFWHAAGLVETASAPPLLQSFVPGQPAMRTVSAWRGEVLGGASFIAEKVHPEPTGASTLVRYIDHAEMAEAVRHFVAAHGCSGFLSFDFIIDPSTNAAALIEINSRPIGTTHLGRRFGQDPCAPLLARATGLPFSQAGAPGPPDRRQVALFPKELIRDPQHLERLSGPGIVHDVPYDDPGLLRHHLGRLRQLYPREAQAIERALDVAQADLPPAETCGDMSPAGQGKAHLAGAC